jgi:hypothetical protein
MGRCQVVTAQAARSRKNKVRGKARHAQGVARRARRSSVQEITILGRLGLAGRTGFYAILTAITVRIAVLSDPSPRQANANGALSLVSQPLIGKVAIGLVAFGFALFGVGRIAGAARDHSVSGLRRCMTVAQGVFYLVLAYVPASFLSGNRQVGSQQQQEKSTAQILDLPAGRVILTVLGVVVIAVCAVQIRGALRHDFRDGLNLANAPSLIKRIVIAAGAVGIIARSLVFVPVGIFLVVAAVQSDPGRSYGTDIELRDLASHTWGLAVLAVVAAGLAVFVAFSAIETRYRQVVSAK